MPQRRRRIVAIAVFALLALGGIAMDKIKSQPPLPIINGLATKAAILPDQIPADTKLAGNILETLAVKGRAPKTGYSRKQFGDGWAQLGNCDVRNHVLARDMTAVVYRSATDCTVLNGTLQDPYTGRIINFVRGPNGSAAVQIDHVIALSNAWQTGAQLLTKNQRMQLANDPLELLAVDGPANQQKSDADAATWLPSNKDYRCRYVARQIAVRKKYSLWVVPAERDVMRRILSTCPDQEIPLSQMPIQ